MVLAGIIILPTKSYTAALYVVWIFITPKIEHHGRHIQNTYLTYLLRQIYLLLVLAAAFHHDIS